MPAARAAPSKSSSEVSSGGVATPCTGEVDRVVALHFEQLHRGRGADHLGEALQLAVELGLQMGLPPDRLRVISRGAFLHDIGKIAIPDEIVNKPGRLTPEERLVVETHPQLGYQPASNAPSLREVLQVILHHHERMDGGGYPADWSAATSRSMPVSSPWRTCGTRYVRPPLPRRLGSSVVLAHIVDGRTTHFDPVVVDALVQWASAPRSTGVGRRTRGRGMERGRDLSRARPCAREHVTV